MHRAMVCLMLFTLMGLASATRADDIYLGAGPTEAQIAEAKRKADAERQAQARREAERQAYLQASGLKAAADKAAQFAVDAEMKAKVRERMAKVQERIRRYGTSVQ